MELTPERAERIAEGEEPPYTKRGPSLYIQVIIAIAFGGLLGWLHPEGAITMKPLGDGFVKLIKMLIGPIVFTTVAVGIAGMKDLKKVGRVGGKALVYFEAMTTVALLIGLAVAHLVRPGAGIHAVAANMDSSALDKTLSASRPRGFVEHLLALIPNTFVGAFVDGDVLQILLLGVLLGVALAGLGERAAGLSKLLEQFATAIFAIVGIVMRLSPLGAFGAMAFTIGKYGVGTLGSLAKLMAAFYVTALLFVFLVLGAVMRALGLSIVKLLKFLREELVIVLGTSSSESALPRLMGKLEALGCAPAVVRLVVPTGYSFNLDGTAIYLTLAALFVAQALDVSLSPGDELRLLLVLLLTSKGAAAVTGSGFVTLAATLSSTGTVPVVGITLLLGVDRFMSEARALTNIVGNAVATIVVARWEKQLDLGQAKRILDAGPMPVAERPAGEHGRVSTESGSSASPGERGGGAGGAGGQAEKEAEEVVKPIQ
ncbi:MAG TPA: C4-dicarboxylate transporter DctA [Labilithrix sp.]|jgi:aerobic C4-dicarboxylate transport protein|nr:C4-dicarboxylate transporter DctA [Labilithrix sp.]